MRAITAALFLICSALSFSSTATLLASETGEGRDAKNLTSVEKVQALIETSLANTPPHLGPYAFTGDEVSALDKDSTPILLDFAFDATRSDPFRLKAFAFLKAVGDERILGPLGYYIRFCSAPCPYGNEVVDVLIGYYKRTADEKALEPFTMMLEDSSLGPGRRLIGLRALGQINDDKANLFLKNLVVLNEAYPYAYHKAEAAWMLAKAGDDSVVDSLIEYARFMLDTTLEGSHLSAALAGLEWLGWIGKKNNRASQAVHEIIWRYCESTNSKYTYLDKHYPFVFMPLQMIGGEDNIKFLQQVISACGDNRIARAAVLALGSIGSMDTIDYLQQIRFRFPEEAERAIRQIEGRYSEPDQRDQER